MNYKTEYLTSTVLQFKGRESDCDLEKRIQWYKWHLNLNVPGICGLENIGVDKRIFGGREAHPHQFPWLVAVFENDWSCTGSLISDEYVLTAAHCVDGATRCQFHQRFSCAFFVRKSFWQLFLVTFWLCQKKLYKNCVGITLMKFTEGNGYYFCCCWCVCNIFILHEFFCLLGSYGLYWLCYIH